MMKPHKIIMALDDEGSQFPSSPLYTETNVSHYYVALFVGRAKALYAINVRPKQPTPELRA